MLSSTLAKHQLPVPRFYPSLTSRRLRECNNPSWCLPDVFRKQICLPLHWACYHQLSKVKVVGNIQYDMHIYIYTVYIHTHKQIWIYRLYSYSLKYKYIYICKYIYCISNNIYIYMYLTYLAAIPCQNGPLGDRGSIFIRWDPSLHANGLGGRSQATA